MPHNEALQATAEKRGPQLSGQLLGIVTVTSNRDQVDVLSACRRCEFAYLVRHKVYGFAVIRPRGAD